MKIISLHIQHFRGIVDLTLDLDGKSAVIFGPNGVGKSAVVDAVDFLLRGDITRLMGAGTGDVSTEKHGPHIGSLSSDAKITAVIQSINGKVFTAIRTVENKDTVILVPNCATEFDDMVTYAQSGAHCLTRRELLRYILTSPSTRAAQIQTLLDIAEVKVIRDGLSKAKKEAISTEKNARSSLTQAETSLRVILSATTDGMLLQNINDRRVVLGGEPLDELNSGAFCDGLTYSDSKDNMEINVTIRALESLLQYLPSLTTTLQQKIVLVQDVAIAVSKEESEVTNAGAIALINSGIAQMDSSGRCPLCLHQWSSEEELRQILLERKSKSETLSDLLDKYINSVKSTKTILTEYQSMIDCLPQQLQRWKEIGCADVLTAEIQTISLTVSSISTDYSRFDALIKNIKQFSDDQRITANIALIEKQLSVLRPLIDESKKAKSDAWKILNDASELYKKVLVLTKQIPTFSLISQKATFLLEKYDNAQAAVLNELFSSVSDRFTEFYKAMHKDDESQFVSHISNAGVGVNMSVDFHGQGQYPPMAFHSEGHQDSMGIALFFALMEALTTSEFGLVVLDDVVMSVDIEHRKSFCLLLKTYFSSRQFIVTTHDAVWAKYLVNEGVVVRDNSYEFLSWSVEGGPVVAMSKDIWDTTRAKAKSDLPGASAFFRREMESYFENICDKLHARIRYNETHKWDYGQYMSAAYNELQALIKKAADQATRYKKDNINNTLSGLSVALKERRGRIDSENWVTNVLVHYNPIFIISESELLSAVTAMETFGQCFECLSCHVALSAIYEGENPKTLYCPCGSFNFSLKQ